MRPADIALLPTLSAPAVHPDGTWAVVAASFPNLDADAYVGQLWRVDLSGAEAPGRLTRGFADAAPAFSPDGSLIAFRRSAPGAKPQLYVIPATGGEPAQVTDAPLGVGEFAFSPDGARLVYVARVPEDGRYGSVDGVDARAEDPRRIDTLKFQSNGVSWSNDRRRHLHLVEVPDPTAAPFVEPRGRAAKALADADRANDGPAAPTGLPTSTQLTTGDFDHDAPTFAADGRVVASSARHADRDTHLRVNLYAFGEPGADPEPVAPGLNAFEARYAADGRTLFAVAAELGESGRDFVGRLGGLYAVAPDGAARRLTDAQTVQVERGLARYGDGGVVTLVNERGTLRPLSIGADCRVRTWPTGDASVLAAAELPGSPDRLVVLAATPDSPAELAILDADGALTVLTDFSGGLRAAGPVAAPIELTATASDGYPVHGWAFVPDGDGPHPVLLTIHGGPHATYGPAFFDEFQVYAAAGYAVVACNPRGAGGYGEHHGRVIKDAMGGLDATDILSFLDHALATVPGLDSERVGVQGGSYGGYMTAWLTAHHDRFAAAIVERGFLDTESFIGPSDIGWYFVSEYNGADAAHRLTQSPQAFADQVTTPTLVLHSEEDLRCPLGPALRYYTTLKLNGVETELLVFPGENHELSRSGTPWHRKLRFEAILDWWQRHLPARLTDGGGDDD